MCDSQIITSASALGLCLRSLTHVLHTRAHRPTQEARRVGGWRPGPHAPRRPDGACVPLCAREARPPPPRGLTFTDGRLPGPLEIGLARPVLRAAGQEEARVAGVDQCVTEGGELDGSHVRVGRCLGLSAGVSWNGISSVRIREPWLVRKGTWSREMQKQGTRLGMAMQSLYN